MSLPEPYYTNKYGVIYHGDCLEILPELPKVDLVLTDPPYATAGMKYESYDDSNYRKTTDLVFSMLEIAEQKAKIVLFPSGKFQTEIELYQKKPPKWMLCWHKGATSNCSAVGFNDWEMIMVYGEKVCVNQHDHFYARNNEKLGNYGHPCPKPLEWAEWLISRFCPDNGHVIDPFLGSGTVAVACCKLKRHFTGIDKEEKYCEIAAKRLEQYKTGLTPVEQDAGVRTLFDE